MRHSSPVRLVLLCGALALLAPCTASVRLEGAGRGGIVADRENPGGPVQMLVWSGRPLPEALTTAAKKVPGVLAVGARRTGVADLRAALGASRPLPARPPGTVLPVSITALDPTVLRAFPALAGAADVLTRGEAIVPATSAAFRGLEVGDAVQLAGRGRSIRVRVGAVMEEGRTIRGEVVLSEWVARRIGIDEPPQIMMAIAADQAAAAEAAMTKAIGTFPARLRAGTAGRSEPSPAPSAGPEANRGLLSLLELKQTFGEFWYRRLRGRWLELDPAWVSANIVEMRLPILGVMKCHRKIVPLIRGAMLEIQKAGLAGLITSSQGCFSPRMQVADADVISRHAYGVAFDFNAESNGFGARPTMDRRIVDIVERWGFTWGGRWTVPDGMHFEFVGFPG